MGKLFPFELIKFPFHNTMSIAFAMFNTQQKRKEKRKRELYHKARGEKDIFWQSLAANLM